MFNGIGVNDAGLYSISARSRSQNIHRPILAGYWLGGNKKWAMWPARPFDPENGPWVCQDFPCRHRCVTGESWYVLADVKCTSWVSHG